ncbi:integrase [Patescibacteria group bacterium]
MDTTNINSIEDMENFLQANSKIEISVESKEDKYNYISKVLVKFRYQKERKKNKTIIKKYLKKITSYSSKQIKRLIKRQKDGKLLSSLKTARNNGNGFKRKYNSEDIALLIKTDSAHRCVNGNATVKTMKREFEVFGNNKYKNISEISVSHLYNIRKDNRQYNSSEAMHYTKTQATQVSIGERRKPQPDGKCGYLRVDSVHQGDRDKKKGVYHINIVDEVTQWEIIGCVEGISDYFLEPLLMDLLKQFPYRIINFHSDNGSEYINKTVEKILNNLMIKQTKSRSRKTNDNALVESKNASVIRKHIGRNYIHKKYAREINGFYKKYFNVYINYHRVCAFPVDVVDKKGKIRKTYPKDNYMTPYDKLKLLKNVEFKENISFEVLDKIAYDKSDNEFAEEMEEAKIKLFTSFKS